MTQSMTREPHLLRVTERCDLCEHRGIEIPGPVYDFGSINAHRACFALWWTKGESKLTGASRVPGPDMNERDAMIDGGRPVRR